MKSILLIFIVIVGIFLFVVLNNVLLPPNQTGLPDPAAVYCSNLGYQYNIIDTPEGQKGICRLSLGIECDAWEFFNGKCGEKYTYCEKTESGDITTTTKGCKYSSECAICTLPDGTVYYEWELFIKKVYNETPNRSKLWGIGHIE